MTAQDSNPERKKGPNASSKPTPSDRSASQSANTSKLPKASKSSYASKSASNGNSAGGDQGKAGGAKSSGAKTPQQKSVSQQQAGKADAAGKANSSGKKTSGQPQGSANTQVAGKQPTSAKAKPANRGGRQAAAAIQTEEPPRYRFLVFNALPSWFVSMIVHAALIIMLAVFTLPNPVRQQFAIESAEPDQVEEIEEFEVEDFSLTEDPVLDSFETLDSDDLPQQLEEMAEQPEMSDAIENPFNSIDVSSFSDQTAPLDAMAQRMGSASDSDLAARSSAERKRLVREGGGSDASERAVMLALEWLAKHQREDGGWDFDHTRGPGTHRTSPNPGAAQTARNGATGLALLPFLGAGQTHLEGKYKDVVADGLRYLVRNQRQSAGGGSFHDGGNMYSHGLCSIALCEAYAMTQDRDLLAPAQAALNFIVYAQDPVGGGWRYEPKQAGDTSVVGWQLMALKSGHMGYMQVPKATIMNSQKFLDAVSTENGAFYGYSGPGKGKATTSIGLLCRMYLGWDHEHPSLSEGVNYLSTEGPSKAGSVDMYYNYYATQVMRHYGGEPWEKWNEEMRDWLVSQQATRGDMEGSWYFEYPWSQRGGRLYNTALACMVLEVYYRHLPIYRDKASEEAFPLD